MAETTAVAEVKPKKLSAWEDFQSEIRNRADELGSQLPSNVSKERFINAAIAAVKQTPDILKADARSLFAAITKAAQDGLLPDGREGIITVYGSAASWNPMAFGLRKRARDLDNIIVDAQVIHANDVFEWAAGDDPHINHKIKIGDRGEMVGAYAIFKNAEEGILHREVMDKAQIEATQNQSKAKNSLMWTVFKTEAWRKTVVRRGFKSVPCSAPLEQLVRRDDDNFDFTPERVIAPPPPPPQIIDAAPKPSADAEDYNDDSSTIFDPIGFLADLESQLASADTADLVEEIFDGMDVQSALTDDEKSLTEAFALKAKRLAQLDMVNKARTL